MRRHTLTLVPRLLLIALHLAAGALLVALLFRFAGIARRRQWRRRWSRQLLCLLGIRLEGGVDLALADAGLLVANHVSFIDIFVINALLPSGFVAKSEVARWPLIGWLSRHNETVFIERGSRRAAHRTQQQMIAALAAGQRLAIFPEGTTSCGDRVLPFHAALFQSAIDAGAPLHVLALSYRGLDGTPCAAPAYIGELSVLECLVNTLRAEHLVARVALATSFTPPLPDRRHLAARAHHAVVAALALEPVQPARNPEAIRR